MEIVSDYEMAKLCNVLFLIPLVYITFYPDSITNIDPVFLKKISGTLLSIGLLYHIYMLLYYLKKN